MGIERLRMELNAIDRELDDCRQSRRTVESSLTDAKRTADTCLKALNAAEDYWRKAKADRDAIEAEVVRWDGMVVELEARRAILERRLFEQTIDGMAKEG